jgi:hypothetical protein
MAAVGGERQPSGLQQAPQLGGAPIRADQRHGSVGVAGNQSRRRPGIALGVTLLQPPDGPPAIQAGLGSVAGGVVVIVDAALMLVVPAGIEPATSCEAEATSEADVHAGQAGRTGPILGVQNTRYERRRGCGADEIEAVIRRHERPA